MCSGCSQRDALGRNRLPNRLIQKVTLRPHFTIIGSFLWGLLKLFSALLKNKTKRKPKELDNHKSLFGASRLKAAVALLVLQPVSVL